MRFPDVSLEMMPKLSEGYYAYMNGDSESDNPYPNSTNEWKYWRMGWYTAKSDSEWD